MRYISGWVVSLVLLREVEDFLYSGGEEYTEREYTIAGNHLMLTSEHTAKTIEQQSKTQDQLLVIKLMMRNLGLSNILKCTFGVMRRKRGIYEINKFSINGCF